MKKETKPTPPPATLDPKKAALVKLIEKNAKEIIEESKKYNFRRIFD